MFEVLGRVDLLVIDDLGAEKRTDWSEQAIYIIIDERYSSGRATLYGDLTKLKLLLFALLQFSKQ